MSLGRKQKRGGACGSLIRGSGSGIFRTAASCLSELTSSMPPDSGPPVVLEFLRNFGRLVFGMHVQTTIRLHIRSHRICNHIRCEVSTEFDGRRTAVSIATFFLARATRSLDLLYTHRTYEIPMDNFRNTDARNSFRNTDPRNVEIIQTILRKPNHEILLLKGSVPSSYIRLQASRQEYCRRY